MIQLEVKLNNTATTIDFPESITELDLDTFKKFINTEVNSDYLIKLVSVLSKTLSIAQVVNLEKDKLTLLLNAAAKIIQESKGSVEEKFNAEDEALDFEYEGKAYVLPASVKSISGRAYFDAYGIVSSSMVLYQEKRLTIAKFIDTYESLVQVLIYDTVLQDKSKYNTSDALQVQLGNYPIVRILALGNFFLSLFSTYIQTLQTTYERLEREAQNARK